jgi:hypothetical protein
MREGVGFSKKESDMKSRLERNHRYTILLHVEIVVFFSKNHPPSMLI